MQHSVLVEKAVRFDEFYLDLFVEGRRQTLQATLTPGKYEPQLTPSIAKDISKRMDGKPHLVVWDRINQRFWGIQARFVSAITPLQSVLKNG